MKEYKFNDLQYFSKFAQKYNQGLVDEIYKNVFVNNHKPDIDENHNADTEE